MLPGVQQKVETKDLLSPGKRVTIQRVACLEEMVFPGVARPYRIMGLELGEESGRES